MRTHREMTHSTSLYAKFIFIGKLSRSRIIYYIHRR